MNFKNEKKGFTLIELLVVIAIIGLLATLAVVALGNARQKSRDAKRVSDIKQVQTALELRYVESDNYPFDGDVDPLVNPELGNDVTNICGDLDITLDCVTAPTYMGLVPGDPSGSGVPCTAAGVGAVCEYVYVQDTAAGDSTYEIFFYLEGATGGLVAGNHCASQNGISNTNTCP